MSQPDSDNPLYYDQYFGLDAETHPCEAEFQDSIFKEYLAIYGHRVDLYICTFYDPSPVFGEDPVKRYEVPPIVCKGLWTPTSEVLNIGSFGKTADDEVITIWFHKNTIKTLIKQSLLDNGLIEEEEDDSNLDKFQRHRRELQEGDILRLHFNNLHYEIDNVNLEPDYQPLMSKYVYEVIARPRLISGEFIGDMQPVTDAQVNRDFHNNELTVESNKLIF